MKILVLGGTVFLGRHIVEQSLHAGHKVTLFNRGQTNAHLFEGDVEKVVGDRATDLGQLAGRHFDACIDPSGYVPRQLEAAGTALRELVDQYVFISTLSVYERFAENLDESAPLATLPVGVDATEYDAQYYGPLKVLCEQAIEAAMPGRVLHVRSGLIVGPYDPTNRFTYWPVRIAKGGDVLAPDGPDYPVQLIDAADQARWILQMLELGQRGIYNVTSDNGAFTLGDVFDAARKVTGVGAQPVYVPSNFLEAQGVKPWMGLPLWLPESSIGMSRISSARAVATGMTLSPLEDTIAATLAWYNREPEREWPAGLHAEEEQRVLKAWRDANR